MSVCKDLPLGTLQVGRKAHYQCNGFCLKEAPKDKGAHGLDYSAHVHDEHFIKAVQKYD